MRGACACAVVCALVAVCSALDAETRAAAERHLLALMGLDKRPAHNAAPRPPVPRAMRVLYENSAGVIPRAAANTVRSFHHQQTILDHRFPNEHRFRLFFNLSVVPEDEQTRGADLIFQRSLTESKGQRLMIYDIVRPGRRGKSSPILRLIDSLPIQPGESAVTADMLSAARRWLQEPQHNHGVLVRVLEQDDRGTDAREPHIRVRRRASENDSDWQKSQPLLLLYTEDSRAREARERGDGPVSRMRRAAQRRGRTHHRRKEARETCQRRPLFVDFADVGWNDWIVAPPGYEAYYCQGDCPFPLADHLNGTNHAIVQTLVNSVNPAAVPKACCVPTQLSSISMLYMDEVNNVVLKNYKEMAVVGCGCR